VAEKRNVKSWRTARAKTAWCLALLAVGILLISPAARADRATEQGPPPPGGLRVSSVTEIPETLRVLMPDNSVRTMYMDDYLKGVLPAEMGSTWPYDALCAQAVAARCYAATAHRHPAQGADV
jgi:peptidoglycan hydrolase-like amidase